MSLPAPYFQDDSVTLYCGDCREIIPALTGITAVVTDPPYELGFMGKDWDKQGVSFDPETWRLILNACLPGAPLLAFGGTRTWHRMVCAIEDAGWEIRDTLCWLYGQGFPKSLDISKAIDKALGAKPIDIGRSPNWRESKRNREDEMNSMEVRGMNAGRITAPATPAAKEWQGYGTALKPAWEPICLAMKPTDGTFAHNALTHGVAGLNIDGCRIGYTTVGDGSLALNPHLRDHIKGGCGGNIIAHEEERRIGIPNQQGRWPANLLLDEEAAAMLDEQSGELTSGNNPAVRHADKHRNVYAGWKGEQCLVHRGTDSGGASRFFYTAKASRAERDHLIDGAAGPLNWSSGSANPGSFQSPNTVRAAKNDHPTVKPLDLMVYLVKLVMPPKGGLILDPFMGSGTTGLACQKLGVRFIGIDNKAHNVEIAAKRMAQSVMDL